MAQLLGIVAGFFFRNCSLKRLLELPSAGIMNLVVVQCYWPFLSQFLGSLKFSITIAGLLGVSPP
jgi:hypothetical protein